MKNLGMDFSTVKSFLQESYTIPYYHNASKWPIKKRKVKRSIAYEKLVFTLCKACAETRNQNKCEHTDNERSFIGTWTTDAINKALKKGNKVIRTYEVWHFDKSTDDLFKGYIRRLMKIKLESSKYDFKTKEEEANFKIKIKKSLDIDIEKFEFNAGLRSISKLCLNSLWGKFGQRSNMSQTKYVTEVSEFYEILLDDKLDNKNFQFINDDMVQMHDLQFQTPICQQFKKYRRIHRMFYHKSH